MKLSSEEFEIIVHEVRENHKRLNACDKHDFVLHEERSINSKYKCTRCEGIVDRTVYFWYEQGAKHASVSEERQEKEE